MKKVLCSFVFTLGLMASCYGMDANDVCLKSFRIDVRLKDWNGALMTLSTRTSDQCKVFEEVLLKQNARALNAIGTQGDGLFELLMLYYFTTDKSDEKVYWKNLLKKLILNGLDFKVTRDGKYLYNHRSDGEYSLGREEHFWKLFKELIQENSDKEVQLRSGFEKEIAAYQNSLPDKSGEELDESDNQLNDQERTRNVLQKLKMPLLYCGIGVCIVLITRAVYKKYMSNTPDGGDEETVPVDANQGQAGGEELSELDALSAN